MRTFEDLANSLLKGEMLGYNDTRQLFVNHVLHEATPQEYFTLVLVAYNLRQPSAVEMTAIVDAVEYTKYTEDKMYKFTRVLKLPFNVISFAIEASKGLTNSCAPRDCA